MILFTLKVALVAFLIVGVAVFMISFIRKSREKGFPTPEFQPVLADQGCDAADAETGLG